MKKISLIIVAIAISCNMFAQYNFSKDKVLQIKPGETNQAQVEQLFGKPPQQIIKDDRARWSYNQNGSTIEMDWTKGLLTECTVRSAAQSNGRWNKEDGRYLEIGTDVSTILDKLGLPNNMSMRNGVHRMEYKYSANTLQLSFIDGQLLRYEMNGTLSKK
jgi:hypothetical protein